jgi:hypothetical protein
MPSKFVASISFSRLEKSDLEKEIKAETKDDELPTPVTDPAAANLISPAPVVHLGDPRLPLLVDYPHGRGRIVILADPYIVSNGGISLKDNLQLAINILVASSDGETKGLIAFDEYHQGRGATSNAFASYFAGTPILPLLGQIALLLLLILWTRSRRFARPIPLAHVDRRSALEFVASMAELQQRAGAYDLALENVYSRTRRVLARYAATEYNSSRKEIAARVASRSALEAHALEVLMRQCEGAINGEPITERQAIQLVKKLRDVEGALGLRMRSRDLKQAAFRT